MGSQATTQQHVIDLTEAAEATMAAAVPVARMAAPARNRSGAGRAESSQRLRWNFTINSAPADHSWFETVGELVGDGSPCAYICGAHEHGDQTERPHIQGFLYLNKESVATNGLRQGQVVDMLQPFCRPHYPNVFPVREGDNHFCINYCKGLTPKKGMKLNPTFREWGNPMEVPGVKEAKDETSYEDTLRAAKLGRFSEIGAQHQLKFYSSIKSIYADAHMDRVVSDLPKPNSLWIWGRAGSGKTTYAYDYLKREYPGKEIYPKDPSEKWWPAYPPGGDADQLPVVMDDIGPFHVKLAGLWKVWLGDRAFISEMKHSSGKMRPPIIICTSQYHPSSIFRDRETLEAMMRRLKVYEYKRTYPAEGGYSYALDYEPLTGTGDQEWALANPCGNDGASGMIANFNLPEALHVPENPSAAFTANAHLKYQAVYKHSTVQPTLPIDAWGRRIEAQEEDPKNFRTPRQEKQPPLVPGAPAKNPNLVVERVVLNLETGAETPMNEEPVLVERIEQTGTLELV